jgi:uncharacterized membrane protein HdeD (DUF308 family)
MMATVAIETAKARNWWLYLLQGTAGILMGLLLLAAPGATLVGLVTFLGFYWLITGVLALVCVFVEHSVPWIWSLISGIVGILAGLFVLNHPLLAALTLPAIIVIVLGVEGLLLGLIQIISGFTGGGLGAFIMGAINVLIGALLLASPLAAAAAVPLVFGVLLLVQGVALVVWAFHIRG